MNHILLVEDELKLAALQLDYLQNAGFRTSQLSYGLDVLPWLKCNYTDLIALDLMLPDCDGLEICREIRRFTTVPIIIISARTEEIDRLLGLEMGADDYICKPYSPREVVARIKAILRRRNVQTTSSEQVGATSILKLNKDNFRVFASGQVIQLTAVEFQLLEAMYLHPGRVFSRSRLIDTIYSDQRSVCERTIDSHIKKLRKKLTRLLPGRELIRSIYSAGYTFDQQE